jgi:hypothetical protein
MTTPANDLNISQAGVVCFDGVYQFFGRTITGGTGVTVTNGNGVAGNPVISLTGGHSAIETINGDTGSISGNTVTIYANNASQGCGSSVLFVNSGTTSTLKVTDANGNTLFGSAAGNSTLSGSQCCGFGSSVLHGLTSGANHVGMGFNALTAATSGTGLTGLGSSALGAATTDSYHTAVGYNSLLKAVGASAPNTAVGALSLPNLTTGINNTCVGYQTGNDIATTSNNTLLGNTTGTNAASLSQCTLIGSNNGNGYTSTESNNIILGYNITGTTAESNVIRIGNSSNSACYITGIDGVNIGSVAKVVTEASNQLGTATITAGTGISVVATANTITLNATGGGFTWHDTTGGSATLAAQNGYKADKSTLTTFTLPTNNALGDTIIIMGSGSGGWEITYTTGQYIQVGSSATTTTTGNLASTNQYDCVTLVCIVASASAPIFQAVSFVGNLSIT